MQIKLGRYRHYKGNEYELLFVATHSETLEPLAVYKALYGDGGVWARPLSMWEEEVTVNGETVKRFAYVGGPNEKKTAVMQLNDVPFFQLQSGEKTVELRLYDEKRRSLNVGDELVFVRRDHPTETFRATVRALHIYPNFSALFSTPLFAKTGFAGSTVQEAVEAMRAYYPEAEETRFGVVGVEIAPVGESARR